MWPADHLWFCTFRKCEISMSISTVSVPAEIHIMNQCHFLKKLYSLTHATKAQMRDIPHPSKPTPGPVWTGAENLASTGIRSPDRPARSAVAIPTALSRPTMQLWIKWIQFHVSTYEYYVLEYLCCTSPNHSCLAAVIEVCTPMT